MHFTFSLLPDVVKLERYLSVLAHQMSSDRDYTEFDSFIQNRSTIFDQVDRGVRQSLETIRINSRWREQNYNQIGRLLTEY